MKTRLTVFVGIALAATVWPASGREAAERLQLHSWHEPRHARRPGSPRKRPWLCKTAQPEQHAYPAQLPGLRKGSESIHRPAMEAFASAMSSPFFGLQPPDSL